jgi:hypothetical protein
MAIIMVRLNQDKRFDKTKNEVALLICFLFDHLVGTIQFFHFQVKFFIVN